MDERMIANTFKALCDEKRVRIIGMLSGGEKCACRLLEELELSQPTLSHHMKILCESGLIKGRREGKWMYYSISRENVRAAIRMLGALTGTEEEEQYDET